MTKARKGKDEKEDKTLKREKPHTKKVCVCVFFFFFFSVKRGKIEILTFFLPTDWGHGQNNIGKQAININCSVRISCGHSWPLRPVPWGQKGSPHHRGHRKTHFLVRTSMIFGADVHDPKGSRKTIYNKCLRRFFGPYIHDLKVHGSGSESHDRQIPMIVTALLLKEVFCEREREKKARNPKQCFRKCLGNFPRHSPRKIECSVGRWKTLTAVIVLQ